MGEKFSFTDDVLKRARELKAQGLKWSIIAERLGCKASALESVLWQRKHLKHTGLSTVWSMERQYTELAACAGKSTHTIAKDIAKARKVDFTKSLHILTINRLNDMGLDKKERDEWRTVTPSPEQIEELEKILLEIEKTHIKDREEKNFPIPAS